MLGGGTLIPGGGCIIFGEIVGNLVTGSIIMPAIWRIFGGRAFVTGWFDFQAFSNSLGMGLAYGAFQI